MSAIRATILLAVCLGLGGLSLRAEDAAAPKPAMSDADVVKAQMPTYPLKTCVVSGEKLETTDMGAPVDYVYKGRLVRFCCKMCIPKFNADPVKFLAKIDEAAKK